MKLRTHASKRTLTLALGAASMLALAAGGAHAWNGDPNYFAYDGGMALDGPSGFGGPGPVANTPLPFTPSVGTGFNGISQVDVRNILEHQLFSEIPPDTMGAVGPTQFMETSNGAYAVYDKSGNRLQLLGDGQFWANAGLPESDGFAGFANGDSRVLFDKRSGKWIVESFYADTRGIQIAVSNTSDATGGWKAIAFDAFPGAPAGSIADYPTLALDGKAVYIGTNDFALIGGKYVYEGTTLSVIKRSSLLGAGGPHWNLKGTEFLSPYPSVDNGFAIQGVNQVNGKDSGQIIAVAATDYGLLHYSVNDPGTGFASLTTPVNLDNSAYDPNGPARQPSGYNGHPSRVIDTLDDRVSSAVWEQHGKIYAVHTITPVGTDHTEVQWTIVDAATNAIIQEGTIGGNGDGFDYYQGAITVNKYGQVVITYNRSGYGNPAGPTFGAPSPDGPSVDTSGNVKIFANTYNPDKTGALTLTGSFDLFTSPINNYHNGSCQTCAPVDRQRWGDYAQVTVDPTNPESFWIIGEYALGYIPNPTTSNSRWGTWINQISLTPLAVPEPATWGLMLAGFGLVGGALRRRARASAIA